MHLCPREKPSNNFHQLDTSKCSLMNKPHPQSCAVEALTGLKTVGKSTEFSIDERPRPRILRDVLTSSSPLVEGELDVLEDARIYPTQNGWNFADFIGAQYQHFEEIEVCQVDLLRDSWNASIGKSASRYRVQSGKLTVLELESGQRPSAGSEQLVNLR